ncbi:MAG: histidine kinase [Bacteroidota bacterium]
MIFKVKRVTFFEDINNWRFTYSPLSPAKFISFEDSKKLVPYQIFAGLAFMIWFVTLSLFFFKRSKGLLFYSLYVVSLFVYFCGNIFGIFDFLFRDSYPLYFWFSQSFIFIAHIPYVLALIYYLETKKIPFVHKIALSVIGANVLGFLLIVLFYVLDYFEGLIYIINYIFHIISILPIPALIYLFFRKNKMFAHLITLASLSLCIGAFARIYMASPEDGLYLDSLYYMVVFCSIEIIIFTLALNLNTYAELKEKFQLKHESFINKSKALRAQLNPHFFFNALNSIQHLILRKKNSEALTYLTKFSRLARNTLESSVDGYASLEEEVKMLVDYLQLESLRFDGVFSYDIQVLENVNAVEVEIPFMITQPFVENAIIHGILPKEEGEKKLHIHFEKKEEILVCTIDDSGVGRKKGKKPQTKHGSNKQSRGIEVTLARLKTMTPNPGILNIVDKTNENGEPLGTKVVLYLPLKIYNF